MTLNDAIQALNRPARIVGVSDPALAADVARRQRDLVATTGLPAKTSVSAAVGLHGDMDVRPVEALLELARGTALNDDPEIAAVSRWWSTIRHLGTFAREPLTGSLRLDSAALQFIGPNQRRVLSEELGIGFGIVAAKRWCRARNPAVGPITAVDVDTALTNGSVPNLRRNGRRQPDYLLRYPDAANPAVTVFELLETKGTVSSSTARDQLGRAATQLAGLTVGGQAMTGVAVSTVSTHTGFLLLAVDPEQAPTRWSSSEEKLEYWRRSEGRPRVDVPKLDVDADELFASATNVDNAALAEYGGQHDAAVSWLPRIGPRALGRGNGTAVRATAAGGFVGTELTTDIGGTGQRLRIFQGVERNIADALRGLDASAVAEAQRAFAQIERDDPMGVRAGGFNQVTDEGLVAAILSDGSMLELSIS